ncbi:MAG: 16S rRNA (adenine(1518)-N(6)/adenine(1519)-N(6))-dimethyltransferase RsmA [Gammaproteobacteria bacterium]|nr:16S rRNA (adenine(1518)-N(6)/adenine(1519)-N(6))-dimethyltransferase RsmA [Gammaproteobacteria bacterium]
MKEHKARKRFGQNFLHDPNVINRIVACINPKKGDRMVEIGPGQGAMTTPLLAALGEIDVVELDRDLIPILHQLLDDKGTLRIHSADALKFDFASLRQSGEKLRVVGNLPYNISTPLIFHLLEQAEIIQDMHFMLQKEVVDRLAAAPDSKAYGRLSVMVQYYCAVDKLFNVGPGAFKPAPKVDSAIVRLVPHAKPPVEVKDMQLFAEVVNRAFGQRRKTLRQAIKGLVSAEQMESIGIDSNRRGETLSLEDFAALANLVSG